MHYREREWLDGCSTDDRGLYAATVALDPYRWQLVRFALWATALSQLDQATTTYEVLHISNPEMGQLAVVPE